MNVIYTADVKILAIKDGAVAQAYVKRGGEKVVTAEAKAQRHPDDKPNPEIAEQLAAGRALQKLGNKIEKRGNGLVKHNDDMKRMRKFQQEKKKETKGKKHRFKRSKANK